jgi:hypothetical protein
MNLKNTKDPLFLHTTSPAPSLDLEVPGSAKGRSAPSQGPSRPSSPYPRASVTWGRGEAPPGGGITPLAIAGLAGWEVHAH